MNKTRNKGLFELSVIFGSCASSQIAFLSYFVHVCLFRFSCDQV